MPVRRESESGGCSKPVQRGRCDLAQHSASHVRDKDGERAAVGQVRDNHRGVMGPGTLNTRLISDVRQKENRKRR